jgi:undecaprenyl-diphosphatase
MPLLLLVLVAVGAGLGAGLAAWRYPRLSAGSPAPAFTAARKVGESAAAHSRFRHTIVSRLDASAATGLALTLALLLTIVGGLGLGTLAYLERTNGHLNGIDRSVAAWGNAHATTFSTHGLDVVTQLGAITGAVIVLTLVLAVAETIRTRSAWIVPFLLVLLAGEEILTNTVKALADRARPSFNPAAAGLGPSFPSGHSATAAAFYAGAALLLSRRRGHVARSVFTGIAVGVAVAVASSRVLLDVHWLSDVIAGLLLGWSWFAVCGIAFGGRLLQFGAPAELAAAVAHDDGREKSSVRLAHAAQRARSGSRSYAEEQRVG